MTELFMNKQKIAIAMAQPPALPGSYQYTGDSIELITEKLLEEVDMYNKYRFDGVILQNFYDIPVKQTAAIEAIAYMTHFADAIKREFPAQILGVLMLWDGCASLAVADAAGADFVRVEHAYIGAEVTSAGILEGQCVEINQMKKRLGTKIPVYADVYEPHSVQLGAKPFEDAAYDTVCQCFADGLFLCGKNVEESLSLIKKVRKKIPAAHVILGGGSTGDNVQELLQEYDGVCVGAWIKDGDLLNPVSPERAKRYMDEVERARA